jgi:hypothetical protein
VLPSSYGLQLQQRCAFQTDRQLPRSMNNPINSVPSTLCTYREHPHPGPCHCLPDVDPTDKVRQHLRELERMIVALPADTKDQSIAARHIRSMIGDQLAELSWWRPKTT